jgi:hypothetical protein
LVVEQVRQRQSPADARRGGTVDRAGDVDPVDVGPRPGAGQVEVEVEVARAAPAVGPDPQPGASNPLATKASLSAAMICAVDWPAVTSTVAVVDPIRTPIRVGAAAPPSNRVPEVAWVAAVVTSTP